MTYWLWKEDNLYKAGNLLLHAISPHQISSQIWLSTPSPPSTSSVEKFPQWLTAQLSTGTKCNFRNYPRIPVIRRKPIFPLNNLVPNNSFSNKNLQSHFHLHNKGSFKIFFFKKKIPNYQTSFLLWSTHLLPCHQMINVLENTLPFPSFLSTRKPSSNHP